MQTMRPIAPDQSSEHLTLRESAMSVCLEPVVRRFLWEINAHWELVSLPLICENLQEMLNLAAQEWDVDLAEWNLEAWPRVIDWIIDNKTELGAKVGEGFEAGFGARGEHPIMGEGLQRHSVYATLCNTHANPDLRRTYRLLQAHLTFAKIIVMREKTTLDEYESYAGEPTLLCKRANPYHAALAVRSMSEGSSNALLRNLEGLVELPPLEFLPELVSVVPSTSGDIVRYRHLVTFLNKAFRSLIQKQRIYRDGGGSSARRRKVHGGRTGFFLISQSTDIPIEDTEDEKNTRRGRHSTTTWLRHSRTEAGERLNADDCPEEDDEDDELDSTDFEDPDFQINPSSFHEVSAAQSMQVQMANQFFPWSYGTLTSAEISPLIMQRSQQMLKIISKRELRREQLGELELLALTQVMFWTSSSIKQARGLNLLHRTTHGRNADLGLIPEISDTPAQWRIRSPLPYYMCPQTLIPARMARERADYLLLPDVADASVLIYKFIEERERLKLGDKLQNNSADAASQPSHRIFRHSAAWYGKQLRYLFKCLDPNTRITESRLSGFLFSRLLIASGGDLSATAIMTGNNVPLSRVKLFYACPSVMRLQKIYTGVVRDVQNELLHSLEKSSPIFQPTIIEKTDIYIGNRACPTRSAVQQAIHRLQESIQQTWQPITTLEHQRHHNFLTLYTLWMFAYTTGVRGISTPFINLSEIDPILRLGTLTDKDSGIGYKTRLVRFTPMLLKQMEGYSILMSRSLNASKLREAPCFFLDERLEPVVVRPSTVAPIMREFLPFPVNIHRRFISSELLDAGCPPEVVSAWMGHWHRGEEPWGKFSSFSFLDYVRVLGSFLDPLLNDLGFRIIRGQSHFKLPAASQNLEQA